MCKFPTYPVFVVESGVHPKMLRLTFGTPSTLPARVIQGFVGDLLHLGVEFAVHQFVDDGAEALGRGLVGVNDNHGRLLDPGDLDAFHGVGEGVRDGLGDDAFTFSACHAFDGQDHPGRPGIVDVLVRILMEHDEHSLPTSRLKGQRILRS